MISLKSLCAVVLAVPGLAKVIMHEQFEPKSFKWYDSKEAARFDYDSGNNPVDPIKEYGLYAKIGDRTYVKSAPLNPPVSVGE
jgi:hypothetical protein